MQSFLKGPAAPVNIAIDGFIADGPVALSLRHPTGDLLRRPALGESVKNFLTKRRIALQLVSAATRMAAEHQLLRPLRIVASAPLLGHLAVPLQFTADGGNAPLQSTGNELLRFTVRMQTVNLDPLSKAELAITLFSH